jgi:hypothetical protein
MVLVCQMVAQQAAVPLGTPVTSWQYHPAGIVSTRRFIAVSTSAVFFQDSRPPPNAVPVTVLLEALTILRCPIPPMPPDIQFCATFDEYIATLPRWERDLLVCVAEYFCPDSSLHELQQQSNVKIIIASDGGHKDDYGSFGWVIGRKDEVIGDCEGVARGYQMQAHRVEGYGRMSLLLLLNHYVRYYNIQPMDDCVSRLTGTIPASPKAEEEFHTRDVDSSNWYLKPDHDLIMALGEVREGLPYLAARKEQPRRKR